MPRPLIVATSLVAALTALPVRSAAEAQTKPLPVIRRSDKAPATPFDRPPLIVLARVFEQRTITVGRQTTDGVGDPDVPPKLERLYRLSVLVLRVNERLPSDPDLDGRVDILLRENAGAGLKLEFGKDYILFIKLSKVLGGLPWPKWNSAEPPPYEIALPEGGFEMVGKQVPSATVRVLRRGDILAPYDGQRFDDVFRMITGQTFLEWEPKYRR